MNNSLTVKSGFFALSGMIFQRIIMLLSGIVIARAIGVESFGIFNLARNICDTLNLITKAGLDIGLVRYLSSYQSENKEIKKRDTIRTALLLTFLFSSLPVLFICCGGGLFLEEKVYQQENFNKIISLMIFALPAMTLLQMCGGIFQGFKITKPVIIAGKFIQPTVRLTLILLFLFLWGGNIWVVLTGTVLSFIISCCYLGFLLYRHILHRQVWTEQKLQWRQLSGIMKYSTVMALSVAIVGFLQRTDILMLGYFAPASAVGQYAVIMMLAPLITLANSAFNILLAPTISELWSKRKIIDIKAAITQHVRWMTTFSTPIFLIIVFYGNQLVGIFGDEFKLIPQFTIILLAAAQLIVGTISSSGFLLSMTGKHMVEFFLLLFSLVLNIIFNYIFIPRFGISGAALSTFLSLAGANFFRTLIVRRIYGFFPIETNCLLPAFLAVIVFGCVYLPTSLISFHISLPRALSSSAFFLVIYLVLIVKLCHQDDKILFQEFATKIGFTKNS